MYGENTVVTFVPNNPLSPNSSYNIYIGTGIKNVDGIPLLNSISRDFSTGTTNDITAPLVSLINPPDGAGNVARNAAVTIRFNEAMNLTSVNTASFRVSTGGNDINGRIAYSGWRTVRFIPDLYLEPDSAYTVTIDNTVTDVAGNPLASPFVSSFITGTGLDNFKPSVSSVNPANGTVDVPTTVSVSVTFSEPMDPTSITSGNFYMDGVSSNITLSAGNTVATLTPRERLFANRSYNVRVTT